MEHICCIESDWFTWVNMSDPRIMIKTEINGKYTRCHRVLLLRYTLRVIAFTQKLHQKPVKNSRAFAWMDSLNIMKTARPGFHTKVLLSKQWYAIPIPELELESEFRGFSGPMELESELNQRLKSHGRDPASLARDNIFKGGIGIRLDQRALVRNLNWIRIDFCCNCPSL